MERLVILLACLISLTSHLAAADTHTLISYNIRNDNAGDKGPRDWQARKNKLTNYLLESKASIIGLQEVKHNQLVDVDKALPDHDHVGVGRIDGKTAGEYSPIFYNRRFWKLDPEQHGTYWLSDTPDTPNSMTWGNRYPRICTWARLIGIGGEVKGKAIYVYNTHWDHISQPSRLRSGQLMLERVKSRAHEEEPVILMGDLNANTDNPAVKHLLGSRILVDHSQKQVSTSSRWKPEIAEGKRIDHIFTSPSFKKAQFKVESARGVDGHAASDHHPVVLRLLSLP